MIVLKTEISPDGQKIYYTANYIKDGFPIAIGKRLEMDAMTYPRIVTRNLHLWINALDEQLQFEELCLKNSQFGTL